MQATPLHHVVVDRRTEPSGKTFRLILLDDGEFLPLIEYFHSFKKRTLSHSWQVNVAQAVGMFLDYIIQLGHNYHGKGRAQRLFWDFAYAVEHGTIPKNDEKNDPTRLFWPAHKESKRHSILIAVRDFSHHCEEKYKAEVLVPQRESTLQERIAICRALDNKAKESFFAHLQQSGKKWRMARTTNDLASSVSSGTSIVRTEPPRFRVEDFSVLVSTGFLKYGGEKQTAPYKRYHIRDMMISILQGAAGLRASEPFHLFVDDIEEDPRNPGHAKVKLFHPCEGVCHYRDSFGREVKDTRQNYLRSIGLAPRNLDHRGNYHAGWKHLALFKDTWSGEVYAPVTFYPKSWGEIFWKLFCIYLSRVRPHDVWHPFLFVTEKGETAGEPYSLKQYIKKHEGAILDLFNKQAQKHEGTTSHGLRHMYGRAIKNAANGREDEKKIIQYCMRHRAIESQEIYTAPAMSDVRKALSNVPSGFSAPALMGIK